jgi:hypothetical protein
VTDKTCPRCGRTDGLLGQGLEYCWHCTPPSVQWKVAKAWEYPCRACGPEGGFAGPAIDRTERVGDGGFYDGRCWPCCSAEPVIRAVERRR